MTRRLDRRDWLVAAALFAIVVCLYWPARHFDFVLLDDYTYVTNNPHVLGGLTSENVTWAATTVHRGYWIPLTWWSYMVDASIGGGTAGAFHVTNIALHAANAALLFLILVWMTGARWSCAVVAAVLAVHPLHVESVAWVTERKDVLCTFFMLLAIAAYVRYTRRPSKSRYSLVAAAFVLSLLAKPMSVTLPAVLLVIDLWPLGRVTFIHGPPDRRWQRHSAREWRALVIEKLPLLAIAAVFSVLTIVTQRSGGALADLSVLPFVPRMAYAVVGIAAYLLRAVWPTDLAAVYMFPQPLSGVWMAASAAALAAITLAVWRVASARPAVLAGWAWYLVTILPVSGILQAGRQWTADRFTYVPLIGVSIAVVWSLNGLVDRRRSRQYVAGVLTIVVLAAFAVVARRQLWTWQDGEALWRQVLTIGPRGDHVRAHAVLGQLAENAGRLDEALLHYEELLKDPTNPEGRPFVAKIRVKQATEAAAAGNTDLAVSRYRQAIALIPNMVFVHNDLAVLLGNAHRDAEALKEFAEAARIEPESEVVLTNYAIALARAGRDAEARAVFERILRINPANELARRALGRL